MGFVRLLPRPRAARDAAAEAELEAALETDLDAMSELEADVSEPDSGDMMGLPALDDLTAIDVSPVAVSTPVASAPVVVPRHLRRERPARLRVRESEGRRREDDDDAESRRCLQGEGLPGAARRPRSAGQPDDEPGAEPGHDRDINVRRAGAKDPDLGLSRSARSTSPSPRSTSPAPSSRSRH